MKKVKNIDIVNFMSMQIGNNTWPIKLLNALTNNAEACQGAFKAYNDNRMKLIEQHGKRNEEGDLIIEDNHYIFDDVTKWSEDINELQMAEVELPITMVSLDDVAKCDLPEFTSLSLDEFRILKFMIED